MLSYKTLAVIVLALSTTPAFSAPVLDNQRQARAAIEEEEPESGGSGLLPDILKNVGISVGSTVLGDVAKHFFGNSSRRDTESSTLHFFPISNNGDLNTSPTAQGSLVRFEQPAPGLEEAMQLDHSQREPMSERDLGKSALGFVASTVGSDIAKHFLNHTRREPQPGKFLDDTLLTIL